MWHALQLDLLTPPPTTPRGRGFSTQFFEAECEIPLAELRKYAWYAFRADCAVLKGNMNVSTDPRGVFEDWIEGAMPFLTLETYEAVCGTGISMPNTARPKSIENASLDELAASIYRDVQFTSRTGLGGYVRSGANTMTHAPAHLSPVSFQLIEKAPHFVEWWEEQMPDEAGQFNQGMPNFPAVLWPSKKPGEKAARYVEAARTFERESLTCSSPFHRLVQERPLRQHAEQRAPHAGGH